MQEKIICPITLEKIKCVGMTCHGSLYEFEAITSWLQNNETDPLTNLFCPTKYIRKIDSSDPAELSKLVIEARISLASWCPVFRFFDGAKNIYKKLSAYMTQIDNFKGDELYNWMSYDMMKRKRFVNENWDMRYCDSSAEIDIDDTVIRSSNTGQGFDFVNLSCCTITKKGFKCRNFHFNNLSKSEFIDCDFSRCQFIGCDLTDTKFIGCRFIGEQVCFYKSFGKNIVFENCVFEYIHKWLDTTDICEAEKILKYRLLDGNYTCYSNGNKIIVSSGK
jgi:hypothetical protein